MAILTRFESATTAATYELKRFYEGFQRWLGPATAQHIYACRSVGCTLALVCSLPQPRGNPDYVRWPTSTTAGNIVLRPTVLRIRHVVQASRCYRAGKWLLAPQR